jgi:hypothetical protein
MPSKSANSDTIATSAPHAPSGPQHEPRPSRKKGLNPFLVAGVAFAVGTALAKLIDWRGHAHPRR